jgi:hypothetical protein
MEISWWYYSRMGQFSGECAMLVALLSVFMERGQRNGDWKANKISVDLEKDEFEWDMCRFITKFSKKRFTAIR